MTVTSVAVATTKFLLGMCDCMVGSDVGKGDLSLVTGFCMCVDTLMCDCTCLRAWANLCPKATSHAAFKSVLVSHLCREASFM